MEEGVWPQSVESWLNAAEEEIARLPPKVADLRTAEQFILCNTRLWWSAEASGSPCAKALVRNGFTAANLPRGAHDSFERFLMILSSAALVRPQIGSTARRDLGADEARLLRAVSLCQEGYSCNAAMVLKNWLPPTAIRVALRSLTAFSILAAMEGLVLPLRSLVSPGVPAGVPAGAAETAPPREMMH